MRPDNGRAQRVAAQLQRELAELIRNEVRDPRVSGGVISEVEVSRDLSVAKVYVLPTAGAAAQDLVTGLTHASGFLRTALAARLRLRVMPELRFVEDETQQRSERIERLLNEEKQRR